MHTRKNLVDGVPLVIDGVFSHTGGNLVIQCNPAVTVEASFTISDAAAIADGTAIWIPFVVNGTDTITERIDPQIIALRFVSFGGGAVVEVRV